MKHTIITHGDFETGHMLHKNSEGCTHEFIDHVGGGFAPRSLPRTGQRVVNVRPNDAEYFPYPEIPCGAAGTVTAARVDMGISFVNVRWDNGEQSVDYPLSDLAGIQRSCRYCPAQAEPTR
jgi:hypothetical protein